MDSEVVQALIVLPMVLVESGLFYLLVRKLWKSSRLEAPSLGRYALGTQLNHFFTLHTQQNPNHPAQNNTYQRISLPQLHNQAAIQKSRVNPTAINPGYMR